jgi:hypothetical protein
MPTKSNEVLAVDAIQNGVRSWLRQEGFRVRGRTFNRRTAAGFTQVIGFQMGSFDPPGTTYFPGSFRENVYGLWTVNLGVYVPEVAKLTGGRGPGSVVQDYHSCIRSRLGHLGPERSDLWWPLSPVGDLIAEVHYRLEAHALPFLASFESRERFCGRGAMSMPT